MLYPLFSSLLTIAYITVCVAVFLFVLLNHFSVCNDIFLSKNVHAKNILLIIAHPDDECMFFGPAVINLVEQNKLSILCLTSGNYYDAGDVRKTELLDSASVFGISMKDVHIVDRRELPDNPAVTWDEEVVIQEILNVSSKVNPEVVITFDDYGVSGHKNHISTFLALRSIVLENKFKNVLQNTPDVYSLDSVPLWRKYISIIDLLVTILKHRQFYLSSIQQALQTQKAMFAHKSQLMWFRRLYIIFSRYMFINTFTQIKPG